MNVNAIRRDFPLLARDDPPVYLDSACMSLKPRQVIDAVTRYYEEMPVCGTRGAYDLSREVGREVDAAREAVARWLHVADDGHVIWTKNATEAINVVSHGFPLDRGDVVLTTDKEHNSNLVPWQVAAGRTGARHEVLASRADGTFDVDAYRARVAEGDVTLVAMVHQSNIDGTTIPAREVVETAHDHGARVLLDGAQAAPHHAVDLQHLGVDFYAVSLHKALGPTGVGVLSATADAVDDLAPFQTGGSSVATSTYDAFEPLPPPARFEAGLQNYAGIIGARAAVAYLERVGMDAVAAHERRLQEVMTRELADVPGLTLLGPEDPGLRGGVAAMVSERFDPHELAILLNDKYRIMVRSGDHCVHAWFRAHGIDGSTRASVYLYNTEDEVRALAAAVRELHEALGGPGGLPPGGGRGGRSPPAGT